MISAVVITYQRPEYLLECISSLHRQTYRNIELIVVGPPFLKENEEKIKAYFPEAKLWILPEPFGTASAYNRGILSAKGEYIALLNDDTVCEENWLKESIGLLEMEPPELVCCASKILYRNKSDMIYAAGDHFNFSTSIASNRGNGRPASEFNQKDYVITGCAAAAVFRSSIFEVIGLFDEDLYAFYDDVEFGLRAHFAGFRCAYNPKAIVYHVGAGSGWGIRALYFVTRNSILTAIRDYPYGLLRRHLFTMLSYRLRLLVAVKSLQEFFVILKAYIAAVVCIPKFLKKRVHGHIFEK
jgi:GT2 family glycosyltransferase